MKRILLSFVLIILVFVGCKPFDDDLESQQCINNCTRITGELTTLGGQYPIRNVLARIRYTNNRNGSEKIVREKAFTEVDSNGLFDMQFEVRDDEIAEGNYFIRFYIDPQEYFFFGNRTFRNWDINEEVSDLIDTERNYKFIMSKRGRINIELENPEDMNPGDVISPSFKVLYDNSYQISASSLIFALSQNSPVNEFDFVAGERIQVEVYRERNGVVSREYDTIMIPFWQDKLEYKIRF